MPTMMICTGVFLMGMMSDYILGEAAEGGGLIRAGEYVEYRPPGAQYGLHEAFVLEPRGIRRLDSLQYRVRVNFSTTKYEGELFENKVITIDAGNVRMKRVDYDTLHELLRVELKQQWNRPLNLALITVGRELMQADFPAEPWESATYFQSEEFKQRKQEKRAAWQAKAQREGRRFSEVEAEMTTSLAAIIQLEKEQDLVNRMMVAVDSHEEKLRMGEYGLDSAGLSAEDLKLLRTRNQDRYKQFQYLRTQSQLETLPGQLAFWIHPRTGTVSKWNNGKGVLTRVSDGSMVAKILYVLVPNWQLFWLSDAVTPEEEELKVFRQEMKYTKGRVPWEYVFTSFFYVILYVCLTLSVALWMFENRELN
jgi:hypothetical protein